VFCCSLPLHCRYPLLIPEPERNLCRSLFHITDAHCAYPNPIFIFVTTPTSPTLVIRTRTQAPSVFHALHLERMLCRPKHSCPVTHVTRPRKYTSPEIEGATRDPYPCPDPVPSFRVSPFCFLVYSLSFSLLTQCLSFALFFIGHSFCFNDQNIYR
jgi:hypothetical protein